MLSKFIMSDSDIPIVKLLCNTEEYFSNTVTSPTQPDSSRKDSIIRRKAMHKGSRIREFNQSTVKVRSSPTVSKETVLPIKPKQRNYPTQRGSLWYLTEKEFDFSILLKNSHKRRSSSSGRIQVKKQDADKDTEIKDLEDDDCIKFFDVKADSEDLDFLCDPHEREAENDCSFTSNSLM